VGSKKVEREAELRAELKGLRTPMALVKRYAWILLWPALFTIGMLTAYYAVRTPTPQANRCANGDRGACRGMTRTEANRDALLIACKNGDDDACDKALADGMPRGPALARLCELGVVERCREAAEAASGAELIRVLRIGCILDDGESCLALSKRTTDPLFAAGLVRTACLGDEKTCMTYGDAQEAAGDHEVAVNAWSRACKAGISDACRKMGAEK
jgi:hypothetical protein